MTYRQGYIWVFYLYDTMKLSKQLSVSNEIDGFQFMRSLDLIIRVVRTSAAILNPPFWIQRGDPEDWIESVAVVKFWRVNSVATSI